MNSLFLFFSFIFIAVTDNHVQQYGEVNQLGGVFVNVNKFMLVAYMNCCMFYLNVYNN